MFKCAVWICFLLVICGFSRASYAQETSAETVRMLFSGLITNICLRNIGDAEKMKKRANDLIGKAELEFVEHPAFKNARGLGYRYLIDGHLAAIVFISDSGEHCDLDYHKETVEFSDMMKDMGVHLIAREGNWEYTFGTIKQYPNVVVAFYKGTNKNVSDIMFCVMSRATYEAHLKTTKKPIKSLE